MREMTVFVRLIACTVYDEDCEWQLCVEMQVLKSKFYLNALSMEFNLINSCIISWSLSTQDTGVSGIKMSHPYLSPSNNPGKRKLIIIIFLVKTFH